MKGLVNFSKFLVISLLLILSGMMISAQEDNSYVSFNIKGKEFHFAVVDISYDSTDGVLKIEGSKNDGNDGIVIEVSRSGETIIGSYNSETDEECSASIWWLEGDDAETADEYYLSIYTEDGSRASFNVTVSAFDGDGGSASGSFSGFLYDGNGVKHEIRDGKFSGMVSEYSGE